MQSHTRNVCRYVAMRSRSGHTPGCATALLALSFCLAGVPSASGQTPSTDPMRTIIPVRFDAANGDITIGSTTYKGGDPLSLHLVALRRQPNKSHLDAPDVVVDINTGSSQTVIGTLSNIQTSYPDAMIMVNTFGPTVFRIWEIGWKLVEFGGTTELGAMDRVQLAFVGGVGRNQGTTQLQRGGSSRPVNGLLAPDSNGNYAFIQTDFVRYDIKTNGDITLGKTTYTVANSFRCSRNITGCPVDCNGQNAFHLLVVDREDLTKLFDNTYCTAASDGEWTRLVNDLNVVTNVFNDETKLVFLGSNGKPIPANWNFGTDGDPRIYPLAQMARALGGHWETVAYLTPNDTYSLVGATWQPVGTKGASKRGRESSSVYPEVRIGQRPSGELHGVLARSGRGNWYSPFNADTSGIANLGFYEILGLDPAPYPHPVGAAEVAAFQYINGKLCNGCNIRNLYDDTIRQFSTDRANLQAMQDSNGKSCDVAGSNADANFCTVRAQLMKEFGHVILIRALQTNLQALWQSSGTVTLYDQLAAYNTVKAQLNPPDTAQSQSLALPIVHAFLGLAELVPEVGELFGVADVILKFATELTTDEHGNEKIDLTSTIANLLDQAKDQFISQGATTGTLFQMVYLDWAKLDALGTALAEATDPSSRWFWSSTATTTMLQKMDPIIRQAAYQNIMAAAYAIGSYIPDSAFSNNWGWGMYPLANQPYAYKVLVNKQSADIPLSRPFEYPTYMPFTYPTDTDASASDPRTSTLLSDGVWLGISALNTPWQGTSEDFKYSPPNPDTLTLLFNPVWKGGLGVYRPAFFNSWPFPRLQCSAAFRGDRSSSGGCDWNAAAPAPEHLGAGRGLTSLTIRAKTKVLPQLPQLPQQRQVEIELTIHNDGTKPAQSISIDSISLRTLAGSGQALLLSPVLPIRLSSLQPGHSTGVFLRLSVPPGITRLSLTEQGTHTSGNARAPEVFRFTEAQSIFLQ